MNNHQKTENRSEWLNLIKKASEGAKLSTFYGFSPVLGPKLLKKDFDLVKDLDPKWKPEEKASLIREFSESRNFSQTMMLYMDMPLEGSGARKNPNKVECELTILNSSKSITEMLVILAGRGILESMGWKNTQVRINSIGNKESIADLERKTSAFIRKKFAEFPGELRQALKKDIFYLVKSKEEKYSEFKEFCPQSLDCLSEESRNHFKEILEYLEVVNIPYIVEPSLISDTAYSSETVFEIISEDGETVLAQGYRWDRLSKKLQFKREVPGVSLLIKAKTLKQQKISAMKETRPKFYLVQFGPEAKQKCLLVLEKLRKAGVHVQHSLAKDKLTGQINSAETLNIPYIILLGQKEALENSVIVRNTSNRSQVSVSIEDIGEYAKNVAAK